MNKMFKTDDKTRKLILAAEAEWESQFHHDYSGCEQWWEENVRSIVKTVRLCHLETQGNYVIAINTNWTHSTYNTKSQVPVESTTKNVNYIAQLDKDLEVHDFNCLEEGGVIIYKDVGSFTYDRIEFYVKAAMSKSDDATPEMIDIGGGLWVPKRENNW